MCDFYLPVSKKNSTFAPNLNHTRSVKSERIYSSQQKQLHFIDAVNKLWKKTSTSHPNIQRLCEIASSSPAPRFYITPKRALSKYYEFKRTGMVKNVSALMNSMYVHIFELYEQALKNNNGTEFKYSIMQDVLDSSAPSFYLSPRSAYKFYCKAMKYKRSLNRKP